MLYIRYILKNVEPLRITNGDTSQNNQIDTLTYISGMTIRGAVIQAMAEKLEKKLERTEWESIRRELFSNRVSYLNAYPIVKKGKKWIELVPSPKGFYENKESSKEEKKAIENILKDGTVKGGQKRAALGRYCYMEKNTIKFTNVELGSDMRIRIGNSTEEKTIFRGQYMTQNQMFCGYIAVQNETLCKQIFELFQQNYLLLGNGRSAGMGKCEILLKEITHHLSYECYSIQSARPESCYLYLLSNTVMCKENGELTGIDLPTLERQLGVEQLQIQLCATSAVKNNGYNRIWDAKLPEMLMYEMGSVFRLTYHGVLETEQAITILEEGIGIRRNEGFGRVLILEQYESIINKQKFNKDTIDFKEESEEEAIKEEKIVWKTEESKRERIKEEQILKAEESIKQLTDEEKQVLKIAAKGYYLEKLEQARKNYLVNPDNNNHPILARKLTNSQLGTIASYAASLQFTPKKAEKALMYYLEDAVKKDEAKRVQAKRQKRNEIKELMERLLQSDLDDFLDSEYKDRESIMGISKKELLTEDEILIWKLQFLMEMIRFANKEGRMDGKSTI